MAMISKNEQGILQGIHIFSDRAALKGWIDRLEKQGCNYFVPFKDVNGPAVQFGWAAWAAREGRTYVDGGLYDPDFRKSGQRYEQKVKDRAWRKYEKREMRKPGNSLWAVNRLDKHGTVVETLTLTESVRKAREAYKRFKKWRAEQIDNVGGSIVFMRVPVTVVCETCDAEYEKWEGHKCDGPVCNLCEEPLPHKNAPHCCNPEKLTPSQRCENLCPECDLTIYENDDHTPGCSLKLQSTELYKFSPYED